jgi:hypothetical protein
MHKNSKFSTSTALSELRNYNFSYTYVTSCTPNQLLIRNHPLQAKVPPSICCVPRMHKVKTEPTHAYAILQIGYKLSSYLTICHTNAFLCLEMVKPPFWTLKFLNLNTKKQGTVFLLYVNNTNYEYVWILVLSSYEWIHVTWNWWICLSLVSGHIYL